MASYSLWLRQSQKVSLCDTVSESATTHAAYIAPKMSATPPVPKHATSLLSQSLPKGSEEGLPSSLVEDEETQFLGQGEKTDDIERAEVLSSKEEKKVEGRTQFFVWIVINTLATIGIVFTNKAIFSDHKLRWNQSTFAAFHFTITALTLYAASRPSVGMFKPCRASFVSMMPLGLAMCLNVLLPNFSLAFSSVAFYQIVRVLLTPLTAIINFVFYGTSIPRKAVYCLVPICCGVVMISYYDTRPVHGARVKAQVTQPIGVFFAFAGVLASSFYTVWIGTYHKKFNMNSMQLLFNQAPISAFILLYVIPFTDTPPHWTNVPQSKWMLILMSGVFASLINISQFFIVAGAGAVSSTVVGHLKTCSIVALGRMSSGRGANDRGLLGILLAIAGIIMYTTIMYQHKQNNNSSSRCS